MTTCCRRTVPAGTPVNPTRSISNFGEDFVWGTGTSAYQFEGAADKGGRGLSIWDNFTHKWPGKIVDGSNGTTAVDFYHKYKEDVKIVKNMGFKAFRFSISWSRVLPSGKLAGGVNTEGIQFYNDLIDELLLNGITPFVTLFHWDLPQALEDEYGGFLSTQIVADFCDYAELCFWEFGDRVKYWITVNEPWSYSTGGYANGGLAPGRGPASSTPLKSSSVAKRASQPAPAPSSLLRSIQVADSPLRENRFVGIQTHRVCNIDEEVWNDGNSNNENLGTQPSITAHNQILVTRAAVEPNSVRTLDQELSNDGSSKNGNPGTEPYIVAHNQLLAHAAAVKLYRDNFQDSQKGQIGIILNLNWFEPLDPTSTVDKNAADRAKDFMFGWFMNPLMKGVYPQSMQDRVTHRLPGFEKYPYEVKGSYDFIGINYYTAHYVSHSPKDPSDRKLSYNKDQELKAANSRGTVPIGKKSGADWLYIYPKGIRDILKWVADTYGKTNCYYKDKDLVIYITENGVAELDDVKKTIKDARMDGDMRIEYHNDHLIYLHEGMEAIKNKGVKVKGYFAWSFSDNFEWPSGYTVRFGLIYVDYKDGYLVRYPKDSAIWFMKFLKGMAIKLITK